MKANGSPLRIVIAQRGWVMVGRFAQTGDAVTLTDAKIVRRWGTTKGLGELAQKGPLKDTVLDEAGTVRLHALSIVAQIDCAEERWGTK